MRGPLPLEGRALLEHNTDALTERDAASSLTPGDRKRSRVRILVFRPHMGQGGADRVTATLLAHLDRAIFEPTLVLVRREGELLSEVPPDVPVIDLKARRLRSAWYSLAKLLRNTSPDILFSMSSGSNPVASLAHFLSGTNCRLVLSRRNVLRSQEVNSLIGKTLLPFHAMLYRRADAIIAISQGVADDLESVLNVPRRLVSVIYNPLPDEILRASREESPPHEWFQENIPVLLAVGRLVEQKGYPELLGAFAKVREKRAVRLIILGEGVLQKELNRLCGALGISEDVHFAGWVPNPSAYMQWCSLFVLASRWEGLCTALLEALGSGAAAVSTDCHAGPAELITSGENGILVPAGDIDAMASAIDMLLTEDSLRRRLGENARRRASSFSAPAIVARYQEALLDGR
jgi:glycosyltransferase involved in cell wall biosynthesis